MNNIEIKNTRCPKTLKAFIEYCNEYPDQRFFQAIRNMFGIGYLIADDNDTFHLETDELVKE